MKQRYLEQVILLISIGKWLFLALVIGAMVGGSTALFLGLLDRSIEISAQYRWYFLSMPVAFLLARWLVVRWAPDASGHGTEKIIRAIHTKAGRMEAKVAPVKLLATIVTIASGGSAGKEGPSAQIGAVLASKVADLLRINDQDRKRVVICGISAGFAAVFGTPVAGAVFAIEVLYLGRMVYNTLFPAVVAAFVSVQVATFLGVGYPLVSLPVEQGFAGLLYGKALLGGLFFGLVALLLIDTMRKTDRVFRSLSLTPLWKAAAGGGILAVFGLVVSPEYLGLGSRAIDGYLAGQDAHPLGFVAKIVTTSITLGAGGSGGVLTPIFFIGSSAGNVFGRFIHADPALFAALGLVSVLSSAANTPIAAIIMAAEMFGPATLPLAAVSATASYLITGHRGVYPSQILAFSKSASLQVVQNAELEKVPGSSFSVREGTVTGVLYRWYKKRRSP